MYLGASMWTTLSLAMGTAQTPKATWKAVPALRLECPPTFEMMVGLRGSPDVDSRLALNQQTTIGKVTVWPVATGKSASYLAPTPSWTFKRVITPMTEMSSVAITGRG